MILPTNIYILYNIKKNFNKIYQYSIKKKKKKKKKKDTHIMIKNNISIKNTFILNIISIHFFHLFNNSYYLFIVYYKNNIKYVMIFIILFF